MRDVYGDTVATGVLRDIEAQRVANPYSPEWEASLLESVRTKTSLLGIGDYETLLDLHKHRNLSAHPVLDQAEVLYSPTKEQVRAYMRIALESVLTKPSILTRKVLETFTDDICIEAPVLPEEDSFHKYLEAKYFKHLTPAVLGQLFRGVWNITFHAVNTQGEENRASLFRALCELYGENPDVCDSAVRNEPTYFSEIGISDNQLRLLSAFLSRHPRAYAMLTDQARVPLAAFLARDIDAFSLAWYCSDSVPTHLQSLLERVKNDRSTILRPAPPRVSLKLLSELHAVAVEHDAVAFVHEIGVIYYGSSYSFDRANEVYSEAVRPFLGEYTVEMFRKLLSAIEDNDQTYNRILAHRDDNEIAAAVRDRFSEELRMEAYPHFLASLGN
jgi:hypothetical protein